MIYMPWDIAYEFIHLSQRIEKRSIQNTRLLSLSLSKYLPLHPLSSDRPFANDKHISYFRYKRQERAGLAVSVSVSVSV